METPCPQQFRFIEYTDSYEFWTPYECEHRFYLAPCNRLLLLYMALS